jgi:hypothetical protein
MKGEVMRRRIRPRYRAGLAALFVVATAAVLGGSSALAGVNGAAFTTDDPAVTASCLNGPTHTTPSVDCNIYQDKTDVWINGGPANGKNHLTDGEYFFVVLDPGSQNPGPNDGAAGNLSSPNDAYTNRTFTVTDGKISAYTGTPGTHGTDASGGGDAALGELIQLAPYNDTDNPGGVYILAICMVPDSPSSGDGAPGVNPSDCKYDAFKVKASETNPASGPSITKDAAGAYNNTFAWTIQKCLNGTSGDTCQHTQTVQQVGGSVTFNYSVIVSYDNGTISDVTVTGAIQVFDPNVDGSNVLVPLDITSVTDKLSDGTDCAVTGGGAQTLTQFETDFAYSCDLGDTLPVDPLDNTATVTWPDQTVDGHALAGGSKDFTFSDISFTETKVDDCTTVTDSFNGGAPTTLGTVCFGDDNPTTYPESRTISVTPGCHDYPNTATESTDSGSDTDTVTVCGPSPSSGLTIGFWKNSNGQNLIKTYGCPSGKTSLASYLATLGPTDQGPFSNATGCGTTIANYVTNVLKGATATNMNIMLKAQMMGTALSVYFSDPSLGYTTTTLSKIKPPSNFLTHGALGGFNVDLTAICPMVDNTSTGTATCKLGQPSTDGFASGAFSSACLTVQGILDFESTLPPFNGSTSNPIWYAGNRTKEEIGKNTFDQINNQDAFAC